MENFTGEPGGVFSESIESPLPPTASAPLSNKEIMQAARERLAGNWGPSVGFTALFGALSVAVSVLAFLVLMAVYLMAPDQDAIASTADIIVFIRDLFSGFIAAALIFGWASYTLRLVHSGTAEIAYGFDGFRNFWKAFGIYFLSNLFIFLWSLLFLIPGIIAVYRYRVAWFVAAEDPSVGVLESLRRSKTLMVGKKWSLFCLQLRFLGWMFLALLFPIGFLWLMPYMQTSFAVFYDQLKRD